MRRRVQTVESRSAQQENSPLQQSPKQWRERSEVESESKTLGESAERSQSRCTVDPERSAAADQLELVFRRQLQNAGVGGALDQTERR